MKQVPELYKHQKEAFSFIKNKDVFALFMEMGTGKSKIAIEKASHLWEEYDISAVIIISPNAVKEQWVIEQFETHFKSDDWTGFVWDGIKTKKSKKIFKDKIGSPDKLFVFSLNVEALQSNSIDEYIRFILENKKAFIIVDESTKIKNGRRKSRGKRGGAKRTNKVLDLFKDVRHKCILTGTPTPNGPFDLWSQFEFLKYNFFRMDHFYFTHYHGIMLQKTTEEGRRYYTGLDEKYFNIIKNVLKKQVKITPQSIEELSIKFGMKTKDILLINKMDKFFAYKNLKELKDKISEITFFAKKKDCLDLPDKVYEKLYCTLSSEQKKLYKDLKEKMFANYKGKELTITNKVVVTLRLQMITGGLFPYADIDIKVNKEGEEYFNQCFKYDQIEDCSKIKTLIDDLENVEKDTSIIIWATFRGEIDNIYSNLREAGYTCEKYYGGSEQSVVTRFKNKDFQILIANPIKGGEGLNLQICTLQYFYSNGHRADARLQAEDRSHRIGQVNKVTYKDIICKGTIDEKIYDVLKRKENLISYFRDKDLEEVLR